jgi:hypothetical protein
MLTITSDDTSEEYDAGEEVVDSFLEFNRSQPDTINNNGRTKSSERIVFIKSLSK